ncbi:MAG: hypothetical protein IT327_32725 [Anaerolineae bacterium]|nr:hypothetical protein [Anaerolineae bacterium]
MIIVALALGLAFVPTHDQRRLRMPDPWAYELAAKNFVEGKWILTNDEIAAARTELDLQGARLTQYIETSPNNWTFRQSPGHPLQLALFLPIGQPRLVNTLLTILAIAALFPLLASRYNERLAFLGTVILLFTPITLTALHYYNMDTYAGGIWPLIGGSLLLGYESRKGQGRFITLLVFTIGFVLSWAVVVRITNLVLLGLCGVYFLILLWHFWPNHQQKRKRKPRKGRHRQVEQRRSFPFLNRSGWHHLALFSLGCVLAFTVLLLYNKASFGHFLDSGYFYSSADNRFFLWNENTATAVAGGVKTWLAGGTIWDIFTTLLTHIRLWLRPALFAWPLWPLALYGFIYLFRKQRPLKRTTWFIFFWLLAVYIPYAGVAFFGVTRALAVTFNQTWGFFVVARYLFPISFPMVLLLLDVLNRRSHQMAYVIVGLYMVVGIGIYLVALSQ